MINFHVSTFRLAVMCLLWPALLFLCGGRGWPLVFIYCMGFLSFWAYFAFIRRETTLLPPPPRVYFPYKKKRQLMYREDLHESAQNIRGKLTSASPLYISEDSLVVLAVVLEGPERGVVKVFEVDNAEQYVEAGKAFDHIPKMVRKLRKTAPADKL